MNEHDLFTDDLISYMDNDVICPQCKTLIDPKPKYMESGSCSKCGNVYYWIDYSINENKGWMSFNWEEE